MGGDNLTVLPPGLPNITGSVYLSSGVFKDYNSFSGAFKSSYIDGRGMNQQASGAGDLHLDFKAANSNAIYGSSNTVQPPTIQLLPQIKY